MTDQEVRKFAHDMNNIFMSILNMADLMLLSVPENSDLRHDLQNILRAGEQGTSLVGELNSKLFPERPSQPDDQPTHF